jgi:hypothetical protein
MDRLCLFEVAPYVMELFPESADLVFFRGADANANKVSWQGDEFTRQ